MPFLQRGFLSLLSAFLARIDLHFANSNIKDGLYFRLSVNVPSYHDIWTTGVYLETIPFSRPLRPYFRPPFFGKFFFSLSLSCLSYLPGLIRHVYPTRWASPRPLKLTLHRLKLYRRPHPAHLGKQKLGSRRPKLMLFQMNRQAWRMEGSREKRKREIKGHSFSFFFISSPNGVKESLSPWLPRCRSTSIWYPQKWPKCHLQRKRGRDKGSTFFSHYEVRLLCLLGKFSRFWPFFQRYLTLIAGYDVS